MLCAVCLSMFSKDELEGTHHTCIENLHRAAEGGCKICISLALQHDKIKKLVSDPDTGETVMPFLQYRWKPYTGSKGLNYKSCVRNIYFDSKIRRLGHRIDVYVSHTDEAVPGWYLDASKNAAIDLDPLPWRVRRELFPLRPIPNSTGHPDVLNIAKMWLENCDRCHNCNVFSTESTSDSEWYPKRLIDVENAAFPRLCETQSERPYNSCYATLSHCWGSNSDFITLSTKNLAEFCAGIAIDTLPKSFRDAVIICKHLGLRYLWIDSLCILQDSHSDWLLHTVEMSSVYQHCYLNLSFDVAADPGQGAFTCRNTDVLQDCYAFSTVPGDLRLATSDTTDSASSDNDSTGDILDDTSDISCTGKLSDTGSPGETGSIQEDSTKKTSDAMRCLVFAPELDYTSATWDLPLSRRGWVVQERLLSPRVLRFTNDRIRWECDNENCLHEGLPYGLPDTGESFDQHFQETFDCFPERYPERSKWGHFDHWANIIRMYSERLLTYPGKDKLVALAAVAQRFAAVFGEEYYAGHFREIMPFDLSWKVLRRHSDQDSSTKRYPTWSWTSVDAEVSNFSVWCGLRQPLVVVEGVSIDLDDSSYTYGPVNGGQLILRGLVVKFELRACQDFPPEYGGDDIRMVHLQEAIGCEKCSAQTCLQVAMDTPEKEALKETFLMPLVERTTSRKSRRAVMGIILSRQTNGFYTRVGYWDSDPDYIFNLDIGPLFDYMDKYSQNHQRVVIV